MLNTNLNFTRQIYALNRQNSAVNISFGNNAPTNSFPNVPLKVRMVEFDFDGTLGNTMRYHSEAWQELSKNLAKRFGNPAFVLSKNDTVVRGAIAAKDAVKYLLQKGGLDKFLTELERDRLIEELITEKRSLYTEAIEKVAKEDKSRLLIPGALEFIQKLQQLGSKQVIASNSRNVTHTLELTGLDKYFSRDSYPPTLIDTRDVLNPKPAPDIFLYAAKQHLVNPSECVVFEDASQGFQAAKSAGMKCIAIGKEEGSVFFRAPDFRTIIKNLGKILNFI